MSARSSPSDIKQRITVPEGADASLLPADAEPIKPEIPSLKVTPRDRWQNSLPIEVAKIETIRNFQEWHDKRIVKLRRDAMEQKPGSKPSDKPTAFRLRGRHLPDNFHPTLVSANGNVLGTAAELSEKPDPVNRFDWSKVNWSVIPYPDSDSRPAVVQFPSSTSSFASSPSASSSSAPS